ncbi:MAG: molybdopterin molybdotransferase MoeA [Chloroflexota bacterium]|nr:molybdopterin molybdotransferase MoeA [Chloroflexota bacterium]
MISLEEARDRMLEHAHLTDPESVPIAVAAGRVPVSFVVTATVDVPPFANSAMDGFALRAADAPGELLLVGEVAAGASSLPDVAPGTTVRIMTGAPIPPGTDAVVPLEAAEELGDDRVRLPAAAVHGFVRAAGHDTRHGDRVELQAEPLSPASIAVLASLGSGEVEVRRRPIVAILSTGDELVTPGERLGPGQLHDANSASLAAAALEAGGQPLLVPVIPDEPAAIEAALRRAAGEADVLVVSGGVSVGRHDHVRAAIERLGELTFWRVAVQPGKPLAFGSIAERPVIGLPGNPVSALVTFELFVRPLLRAMLGLSGDGRLHLPVRLVEQSPKDPQRRAYLRVVLRRAGEGWEARPAGGQGSAQLRPLAAGNALLVVPEGERAGEAGAVYDAILLGGLA